MPLSERYLRIIKTFSLVRTISAQIPQSHTQFEDFSCRFFSPHWCPYIDCHLWWLSHTGGSRELFWGSCRGHIGYWSNKRLCGGEKLGRWACRGRFGIVFWNSAHTGVWHHSWWCSDLNSHPARPYSYWPWLLPVRLWSLSLLTSLFFTCKFSDDGSSIAFSSLFLRKTGNDFCCIFRSRLRRIFDSPSL